MKFTISDKLVAITLCFALIQLAIPKIKLLLLYIRMVVIEKIGECKNV